jgi:hypothetical protein
LIVGHGDSFFCVRIDRSPGCCQEFVVDRIFFRILFGLTVC